MHFRFAFGYAAPRNLIPPRCGWGYFNYSAALSISRTAASQRSKHATPRPPNLQPEAIKGSRPFGPACCKRVEGLAFMPCRMPTCGVWSWFREEPSRVSQNGPLKCSWGSWDVGWYGCTNSITLKGAYDIVNEEVT